MQVPAYSSVLSAGSVCGKSLACTCFAISSSWAARRSASSLSTRARRCISTACVTKELEIAKQVDRKSTRLNSSHSQISYAVFCLKKKDRCLCPRWSIDFSHQNACQLREPYTNLYPRPRVRGGPILYLTAPTAHDQFPTRLRLRMT